MLKKIAVTAAVLGALTSAGAGVALAGNGDYRGGGGQSVEAAGDYRGGGGQSVDTRCGRQCAVA